MGKKEGDNKYSAVAMRDYSFTDERCYNSDPLCVRQEQLTESEDDNISIATFGTINDCLDDEFESELNALSQNPSVSPNANIANAEREQSVSLSLESISNSEDDEALSPPPPRIAKK